MQYKPIKIDVNPYSELVNLLLIPQICFYPEIHRMLPTLMAVELEIHSFNTMSSNNLSNKQIISLTEAALWKKNPLILSQVKLQY